MNALANIALGGIVPIPNMRLPKQGPQGLPVELYFADSGVLEGSLESAFTSGAFDFVQAVFIDNKSNTGSFDLIAPGMGNLGRTIRAQPYTQGWYPFTCPQNDPRFRAETAQGQRVPLIFANVPMAYVTWGPADGAVQVPPLTNYPLDVVNYPGAGEHVLVAGVANQSVSLYRGAFTVDGPGVLKWLDGPGGTVLFTTYATAGGSMFFAPSGVPWFVTTPGNALVLSSDSALNLYGGFGVTQA